MRRWFAGLLALALCAGCVEHGEQAVSEEAFDRAAMSAPAATSAPPESAEAEGRADLAGEAAPPQPQALKSRKIIYTASLAVQVQALDPVVERVRELIEAEGGYVAGLSQSGGPTGRWASLTLRVPADRFAAAMTALAKLGTVTSRELSTEDVSDQWVDLDAQLRNKRLEEERLLAILANTGKVADLLAVEKELARVRGEIERLEGTLRRLNDQIGLSTITLTLELPPEKQATADGRSWLQQVCGDAAALFVRVGKSLLTLLINIAVLLPYLALLWLAVWLVRRRRR